MGGLQAQSMNYYSTVLSGRAVQVARSAVEDAARCSNGGIGVLSGCTISGSGGSCTAAAVVAACAAAHQQRLWRLVGVLGCCSSGP